MTKELEVHVERSGSGWELKVHGLAEGTSVHRVGEFLENADYLELAWYLQDFHERDRTRARLVEERIVSWGKHLLKQLLRPDSAHADRQLLESSAPRYVTVVSSDPEAFGPPFELLRNTQGPLFRQDIVVRRRLSGVREQRVPTGKRLRVLLLIARPTDQPPIDPRITLRSLLHWAQERAELVEVRVVRPATLAALEQALHESFKAKQPYDVVHLDCHGSQRNQLSVGRLAFEDDDGRTAHIDAQTLADVMVRYEVPLVVVEACRSGYNTMGRVFRAVAPLLLSAGCSSVIGMSHNVLVESASLFCDSLYEALIKGRTVGEAVSAGRTAMLATPSRQGLARRPEQFVDWFVPQLYQAGSDRPLLLAESDHPEGRPQAPSLPPKVGVARSHEPLVGRHEELARLDQSMARNEVVLLCGMAGMGKTRLALELLDIWHRTGSCPDGVVYVDLSPRRVETHQDIETAVCIALGKLHPAWADVSPAELDHILPGALFELKSLWVLDLGATPLDADGLIAHAIEQHAQGGKPGRLLVVCRGDPPQLRRTHKVHLRGLGRSASARLIVNHAVMQGTDRDHVALHEASLERLVRRSGGYPPLLLEFGARVGRDGCDQVLSALDAGEWDGHIAPEGFGDLPPDDSDALFRLAGFSGQALRPLAELQTSQSATELLPRLEALERSGFVEVDAANEQVVSLHPLMWGRRSLEDAVVDAYVDLSQSLEVRRWSDGPSIAARFFVAEQDNLRSSIGCLVQANRKEEALRMALAGFDLAGVSWSASTSARWLALAERVSDGDFVVQVAATQRLRQTDSAGAVERLLALEPEDSAGQALRLHSLGRAWAAAGVWDEAKEVLRGALDLWTQLAELVNASAALTDLSTIAVSQGGLAEGRALAKEALRIAQQVDAQESVAAACAQLATVSIQQGRLEEAEGMLSQALAQTANGANPELRMALLQQAAVLAVRVREWTPARRALHEALAIADAFGFEAGAARAHNLMGVVYYEAELRHFARDQFERALAVAQQVQDADLMTEALNNLAACARAAGDYDEANDLLLRAEGMLTGPSPSLAQLRSAIERTRLKKSQGDSDAASVAEEAVTMWGDIDPCMETMTLAGLCAELTGDPHWSAAYEQLYSQVGRPLEEALDSWVLGALRETVRLVVRAREESQAVHDSVWTAISWLRDNAPKSVVASVEYLAEVAVGRRPGRVPSGPEPVRELLELLQSQLT